MVLSQQRMLRRGNKVNSSGWLKMIKSNWQFWCSVLVVTACSGVALGGSTTVSTTQPAGVQAAALEQTSEFWPDLSWPTVCWFGAIAILLMTIRVQFKYWLHNADGKILAAMCLLLALRGVAGTWAGHSWLWWAYLGLTVAMLYWLLRGLSRVVATGPVENPVTVSHGVRAVMLLVALAVSFYDIATAPLSTASRDAVVGGLITAETGHLPYGEAPAYESRNPLLYLTYGGAVQVIKPDLLDPETGTSRPLTWEDRDWWQSRETWLEDADLPAARLVNALLFLGVLAGLLVIGQQLHSGPMARGMVVMFCLFPGTLECLPQPDIMIATLLLTWAVAFSLVPGVRSLLGMLVAVLAGAAWPWAWLAVPVLLLHFFRQGAAHVVGSIVGLLGGVALCVAGILAFVSPAPPRADGALQMAGEQPTYAARVGTDGTLELERLSIATQPTEEAGPATAPLWDWLISSDTLALNVEQIPEAEIAFTQIRATGNARDVVRNAYVREAAEASDWTRFLVHTRTLLEATWIPAARPQPQIAGTWHFWGGPPPMEGRWVMIRRIGKVVVGLLTIWMALLMLSHQRRDPRYLVSALLVVLSGGLLVSEFGAGTYLVWVTPLILAHLAVEHAGSKPPPPETRRSRARLAGGPPRPAQPTFPSDANQPSAPEPAIPLAPPPAEPVSTEPPAEARPGEPSPSESSSESTEVDPEKRADAPRSIYPRTPMTRGPAPRITTDND